MVSLHGCGCYHFSLFDADLIVLRAQGPAGLHNPESRGAERGSNGLTVIFIGRGEPARHQGWKAHGRESSAEHASRSEGIRQKTRG